MTGYPAIFKKNSGEVDWADSWGIFKTLSYEPFSQFKSFQKLFPQEWIYQYRSFLHFPPPSHDIVKGGDLSGETSSEERVNSHLPNSQKSLPTIRKTLH